MQLARSSFASSIVSRRRQAPARPQRTSCVVAKAFKVTLQTPTGDRVIDVPADKYILDAALEAGIDLPHSCQAGTCASCLGKVMGGEVDQTDAAYLDPTELKQGLVLLCAARPTQECIIKTHQAK